MKKLLAITLAVIMALMCLPFSVFAEENTTEYKEIYTVEDLYNVRLDMTANYILMNDIDLTEATAPGGDWDFYGNGWNPIGSNNTYSNDEFSGIFDGNGHEIKGMRIEITSVPSGTSSIYAGLFANVSGTIKSTTLTSESITISNVYNDDVTIGGICSACTGTIIDCSVSVSISSSCNSKYGTPKTNYVGGIVGISSGKIERSSSNVVINASCGGYYYAGNGTYSAKSCAKGYAYAAGIAGYSDNGSIIDCYTNGTISVYCSDSTPYKGSSDPVASYGTASGISCGNPSIVSCYNNSNIKASGVSYSYPYAYGITSAGSVDQCYNTGTVSGKKASYAIGGNDITCYYLVGSGNTSTGAISLTESQMKLQSMYSGFDFENVWILDANAIYPYPQLRSNVQNLQTRVDELNIIVFPDKTDYLTEDSLSLEGLIVEAVYATGESELIEITPDMISGFDTDTAGAKTVTITYKNASSTFTVNVEDRPTVTSIELISSPAKTEFTVNTEFDFSGAKIKVYYENGTSEIIDVSSKMVSGGNINKIGSYSILVTFAGYTTTFNVEVTADKIIEIEFASLPEKLLYDEGEALDTTGLTVVAVFASGKKITLTSGYTVSEIDSTEGSHTVTVSYQGLTKTFEVMIVSQKCGSGDVDGNGKITIKDVSLIKRMILGTIDASKEADLNGDGKITGIDVNLIKNLILDI